MENENQTVHKRRVRYKGKYPKKFEEKYKELQPEKYKDTIAHVIEKGNTPAGMHISIMVKEILDFLQIKPGQTGFDATLGYGGHTKAMLKQLQGQGHIHATDVDPVESAKTKKRLAEQGFGEDILTVHLQNFCTIDEIAKEVGGFDFILADLGVSSMQIDNPERGFSFKVDGPLDLRLNQEAGISAAERLDTISRDELAGMLYENSDEPYCEELAKAITDEIRKGHRVDTTTKLRRIIEDTLDFLPEKEKKETIKKTCQRTFQALRIDVNREFEVLYEFMEKLPGALKPGGRVAILTFHSGEDKLVKRALKEGYRAGIYSEYAKDVVRPSAHLFFQCVAHSGEVIGISGDLCSLFACIKVLGTGIQSIHHQLVGVGIFQVNHDHTLLGEHEANAAHLAQVAAKLIKVMAHVGSGTVAVIGQGFDHNGNAAGAVTFIGNCFVLGLIAALGALDDALNVIIRHTVRLSLSNQGCQLGVGSGVAAAFLNGNSDLATDLGENLGTGAIGLFFLALNVIPFAMSGHENPPKKLMCNRTLKAVRFPHFAQSARTDKLH